MVRQVENSYMQSTQTTEKVLLRIEEAAIMLSLGRAKAYQMAQRGELPGVVRIGRSVRISAAALRSWIDGQLTDSAATLR